MTFSLTNRPAKASRKPLGNVSNGGQQKALFTGLDCLPGQQDLFDVDGASKLPADTYRVDHHGTSGTWYPIARAVGLSLDEAQTVAAGIKAEGYGVRIIAEADGHVVIDAPWQVELPGRAPDWSAEPLTADEEAALVDLGWTRRQ